MKNVSKINGITLIGLFVSLFAVVSISIMSTTTISRAAESSLGADQSITKSDPMKASHNENYGQEWEGFVSNNSLTLQSVGEGSGSTSSTVNRSPNGPTIVGGEEAEPGAWPWQVAIVITQLIEDGPNYFTAHQCGGTLIHREWVLTAAHCTFLNGQPVPASIGSIVAGVHNLSTPESPHYQQIELAEIVRHPEYNPNSSENDLALLKLATPVILSDRVQILSIANSSNIALTNPGIFSIVTGWGITETNGTKSEVLKQVTVPITSNEQCSTAYEAEGKTITEGMICAGGVEGEDSCNNDSGGPLVVPNLTNSGYLLAGLVNFGSENGCAIAGIPGVYARVSHYESWIKEYITEHIYFPIVDR